MIAATEIEFEISGAPVPCARPRVIHQRGRGVRTIMPAKTVDYERHVGLEALAARPAGWPLSAFYAVHVVFYREANRGDVDNFLKSLFDGAAGVLWWNDKTIVDVHARLRIDRRNPRTHVLVRLIDEELAH